MKRQFLFGRRRVGGAALFNRVRRVYANRGFVTGAARGLPRFIARESARQATSASTGVVIAPVIIATASDIVTFFGSTTVRRLPTRRLRIRLATSRTLGMLRAMRILRKSRR